MGQTHLFEDFGAPPSDDPSLVTDDAELEEQKLEYFENGYKAGWEDAIKAQTASNQTVSSELATNLQDASFKYHEMRASLNRTARDILQQVVRTALPKVARASLGARICEEVGAAVRDALEARVVVAVTSDNLAAVRTVLGDQLTEPYDILADDSLSPDQAEIRIDQTEIEVDMAAMLSEIDAAVAAYFETNDTEVPHDRDA